MSAAASLQNLAVRPGTAGHPAHAGLLLQRKCACGAKTASLTGECAQCKDRKRLQARLAIGPGNDPLEREADRVADQVLAAPAHPVVASAKPRIQRFAEQPSASAGRAPASVERVLAAPGAPLVPALRQDMEQRFGHDFSKVRVHSSAAAEQSAREVNALAYTVGHDIVFGAGRLTSGTHEGRRLIAHELTHVVQQSGAGEDRVGQINQKRRPSPIVPIPALQPTAGDHVVNALLQRSLPLILQRAPSYNPGLTVTPILDPDPAPLSKAQPPKVSWISKQRQTVDGKQIPDAERMRVGELLIVRVGLDHVEPAALRSMGSVFITDALTKVSFTVDETGVIQINFRATKIGAEHAEMRFTPAGTAASNQVTVAVTTHVEMSQEAFRGQLQEATQYATNAYHAANLYMSQVSPPYREAWENVKTTLEQASKGNPFNDIVLHLVITFLAGLAGGKALEVLEELKVGKPLTEGLKELTLHATEMGLHLLMPKEASVKLPQDPADWVDACHQQIETEALAVGTMLEEMIKADNENRADFYRDVNLVAAVHSALTFNGQSMRSLETATPPKAEDFEKMIWKGFLVGYHGIPDIFDADAWLTILHRLDNIGEDGMKFVEAYLTEGDERKKKQRIKEK